MRISLVALVTGLAAAALADAIPAPRDAKPKYYFPREVKRQILGLDLLNITTPETTSSSSSSGATTTSGLVNELTTEADPTATGSDGSSPTDTSSDGDNSNISLGLDTVLDPLLGGSSETDSTSATEFPTPTDSAPAQNTDATATDSGTQPVTTDAEATTESPTASESGGLLPSIVDGLTSSLLPSESPTPTDSATDSVITPPAQTTDGGFTGPTTAPTTSPGLVDSLTSDLLGSSTSEVITPPTISTTSDSGPISTPTDITTTSIPPGTAPTSTSSQPGTEPTTTSPAAPTDTNTDTNTTEPIVTPSETTPPATTPYTTPVTENTATTSSVPSVAPVISTTDSATSTPPQTIKPTATNTATALTSDSVIVSATSTKPTTGATSASASTIPSSLPRVIMPNGGVPTAPDNGTLIQLGFTYGLNYPFVVSNSWAVQQIFDYLPSGVAEGIGIEDSQVVMQYLQPYNTLARNSYITTLAMAFIPDDQVNPLSVALLNPRSDLYNNGDPTVNTLMGMLDPSIPLIAGQQIADGSPINSANTATTSDTNSEGGAAGSDDSSGGSSVKPSSIGIGLGVVGGAAVYGVAMFMVAKRYKKRKNAHKRASSVQSGSSNGSGPAENSTLMTGARNSYGSRPAGTQNTAGRDSRNSDRSQQSGRTYISPPVMAENSLGWN